MEAPLPSLDPEGVAVALAELAAPDALPDALDPCPSPWPLDWLAKVYSFADRGVALIPVPFVHDDGVSGSVVVNVMSAH